MALEGTQDQPQELLKKADQLRLAGSYDQAQFILEQIIQKNPFFAPAKLALGRVFFEIGDLANARSILEEFSEFVPDHSLANKILAKIYIYFSQYPKAREKINLVLSSNPDDEMAKKMLLETEQSDTFQEQNLNEEDTKKTTTPVSTPTIAEIYRSQGHLAEALEIYNDLLKQNPDHPVYLQRIQELEIQLAPPQEDVETSEYQPSSRQTRIAPELELEPDTKPIIPVQQPEIRVGKTRLEKLQRMLYLVQQHRGLRV